MIKVLFVINKFSVGGAETIVLNQVNFLDKNKFDARLGLLFRTDKSANLYGRLNVSPDKVVHFGFRGLVSPVGFWQMYRYLRKEKIEVVIGNLFESNFAVRIVAWFAGVKVVIAVEHSVYKGRRLWQRVVNKFLAKITTIIVAVSEEVARFTSASENIPFDKFVVLKQIVDPSLRGTFTRAELRRKYSIPETALVSVTVGRFSPEKAQFRVVEVADALVNGIGITDAYFFIVGYGRLEDDLKRSVLERKLQNFVFVISDAGLAKEYLVAGDVFLLPSDREGMPVALIEAMYQGLVPIASAVGGISEIIENDKQGFTVPVGDVGKMVLILSMLVKNRDELTHRKQIVKNRAESGSGKISELEKLIERFAVKG